MESSKSLFKCPCRRCQIIKVLFCESKLARTEIGCEESSRKSLPCLCPFPILFDPAQYNPMMRNELDNYSQQIVQQTLSL